jgi:FixJ family two-component response regulator
MTPSDKTTVFIIDDDDRMRAATQRLLKTVGLHSESFATPQDFLRHKLPDGPSCLVLDVRLPGMSGLEVQQKLNETGVHIPTIFITGHGDIPMTVKAVTSAKRKAQGRVVAMLRATKKKKKKEDRSG